MCFSPWSYLGKHIFSYESFKITLILHSLILGYKNFYTFDITCTQMINFSVELCKFQIMIIDYKLTYPSGTATAVLINGFHTPHGDAMAKYVGYFT